MKLLRRTLWTLLLLLLLLTAAAVWLLASQSGTSTLLSLAAKALPDALEVERAEGSLTGPLQLNGVSYQADGLQVSLRQARLDWRPRRLAGGELAVDELSASGVTVRLPPPSDEPDPDAAPFALADITLPLGVDVNNASLDDVKIWPHGAEQPIVLDSLRLRARSEDDTLVIEQLSATLPQASVSLSGRLTPTGDYPLDLDIDWRYRDRQFGELRGSGHLGGAVATTLSLTHRLDGAATAALDARIDDALGDPGWQARLQLTALELERFDPKLQDAGLHGELNTSGRLDDFSAKAEFNARVPQLGPVAATLDLDGDGTAIDLRRLSLSAADAPLLFELSARADLVTQRVAADGRWRDLGWPLSGEPQYRSPQGSLTVSGTLQDYRARLSTRLDGALIGALDATLDAAGSDRAVTLEGLRVTRPDGELELTLRGEFEFDGPSGKLSGDWQHLGWPLNGEPQYRSPQGTLTASGSIDDYRAELDAELDGELLKPLRASLRLHGDGSGAELRSLQLNALAADDDTALSARGEVRFDDLTFQGSGDWRSLSWPMTPGADPEFQSSGGEFSVDGSPDDYRFALDTEVDGAALPAGRWRLRGDGDSARLDRFELVGDTLDGRLLADGSVAWQPHPDWQINLAGRALNPGVQWPDVPGELSFALASNGELRLPPPVVDGEYFDQILAAGPLDGLRATLRLAELDGTLRQQQISGVADLTVNGLTVDVETLSLNAGEATLEASGGVADALDLDWTLSVPALGELLPGARGRISSSGKLRGALTAPQAEVALAVDDLAYADARVDRLRGDVLLDAGGERASTVKISGSGLAAAGQRFESLQLDADGTPAEHRIKLDARGEPGDFTLALAGGVDDDRLRWRGRIAELAAAATPAGSWRLSEPAALTASAERVELERACLLSRPASACLQGRWSGADGASGQLLLERFDLARVPGLPAELTLDNRVDATVDATLAADGSINADVDVDLSDGTLRLLRDGDTVAVAIAGGQLRADASGEAATATLQLDLGELGRLDGEVKVSDLSGARNIDGRLRADIEQLAIVSKLAPQLQEVEGRLGADLSVSGALPVPTLRGEVTLSGGALQVPEAGIAVSDVRFAISADGDGPLTLSGQAQSGPGQVKLDGQIDPFAPAVDLSIRGESFQVVDAFNIKALVSPDLNIVFADNQVRVSGELTIPQADLGAPQGITSAVGTSQDVVIVEQDGEAEEAVGIDVFANVRVILGDQVFVRVAGFDGQLAGDLRIEQTPQLAPRGTGNVEVVAGDYSIYGEDLTIQRGRVLFSGGPIDNPGLDLRVARRYDDVTAGAQVSGTLRQPELTLFSDPPMPDSSILSYIVFGKPSSENSLSENALLSQAVAAIGNSKGGVVDRLSKDIGLDTLAFDGGGSPDEASVTVGKYLSPDLYVSYGIGLFDALNTFSLSYKISEKLRFESSSNASNSSADLLYSVER